MLCYEPGNKDIQVYLLLVLKSLIFTFSLKKDKPTLLYRSLHMNLIEYYCLEKMILRKS